MLGHPNQKQKLNKIKGFRRFFLKILKSAEVRKVHGIYSTVTAAEFFTQAEEEFDRVN